MTGIKKIFLAQVTEFHAEIVGNVHIIIDDQSDVRALRDGQNLSGHPADFVGRGFFGAKLDQIRAAVAKLLRDNFRCTALQIGCVHESIKPAIGERFHVLSEN